MKTIERAANWQPRLPSTRRTPDPDPEVLTPVLPGQHLDAMDTSDYPPSVRTARKLELAQRLKTVSERIAAAASAAGRTPEELTLIAITKTWPAADVRLLADLGVRDMGENQDQQARVKAAACVDLIPPLTWHFVGQLQSNKASSVARYAALVHSVDRPGLVTALGRAAELTGRVLSCLVQVNMNGGAHRGGTTVDDVPRLAELIARQPGLTVAGVMAVAPQDHDPERVFAVLHSTQQRLLTVHPGALIMSAGMSGDLEIAVAAGATHLRIGAALLGTRPPMNGQ